MSRATNTYSTRAPAMRAFSLLAELLAASVLIGGGALLTAVASLA